MTRLSTIFTSTSRSKRWLVVILALHLSLLSSSAQGFLKLERDTVPFFRGFAVSADLVGLAQMQLGDYGQYEAALRVNLHDQYFPILEVGVGRANHEDDEVTGITYKTSAPYFRLGVDFNIMKNKHAPNRIYAGLRYGYTSYKCVEMGYIVWRDRRTVFAALGRTGLWRRCEDCRSLAPGMDSPLS